MKPMTPRPPIIVIGMHRSGTSLITRVLEQHGLYMGWRKETNNEALFFLRLNEWLLAQTGHAWDNPPDAAGWPGDMAMRQALYQGVCDVLPTLDAVSFWGLRGLVSRRNPFGASFPWGWKDPRNTITLPVWLDVFPDARVVHIRRHGLDVAHSLTARNKRLSEDIGKRGAPRRWPFTKIKPLWLSSRCGTIDDAFALWEAYMRHAERHVRALGPRALDIRFEDFLESPEDHMGRIADFCGLREDNDWRSRVRQRLDGGRAHAYRNDPALIEFEDRFEDRLAAHGY